MHIESLEITNFKSIRHLQMTNIPDLVVISGPNGAGKTALFDALRLFKESIASYSFRSPGMQNWHPLLQQIGPVVTVGETTTTIRATIRVNESERQTIDLPPDHPDTLTGIASVNRAGVPGQMESVGIQADADFQYLRRLLGERYHRGSALGVIDHIGPLRSMGTYQISSVDLSAEVYERELQALVVNSSNKFANLPHDLVMMRLFDMEEREKQTPNPRNYIAGVRQIFHHFLPNVEFQGVDLSTVIGGPVQILVRSNGIEHDLSQLSSGQREILMTYTHLEKLRPTGSIILFDEPELHLHPALQRRVITHLRNVLERGSNQIWVVTHSEEIVGTTEYESLFAMTGGDPAITPVASRADRLDLLSHLGASIGLQLLSPHIVFVEGQSDAELLPLFFESLPSGVSIVPTGGKSTLMRFAHTAMPLLDKVVAEGQFFLVRDHDVEDEPDVLAELAEKYKGHFFVWDRYHIENYLLDEKAIAATLAEDVELFGHQSPASVLTELLQIADSTRSKVIARHLEAKFNPNLRRRFRLKPGDDLHDTLTKAAESRRGEVDAALSDANVEQAYAEVCADVEQRWDTDWKALCIGRDVLIEYHTRHVRPHLSYEAFRNHIARTMRDMNRVPKAVTDVFESVFRGLASNVAG